MPYKKISGGERNDEFNMYFEIHNGDKVIRDDDEISIYEQLENLDGKENVVLVNGFLNHIEAWSLNLKEFTKDKEYNYLIFDNRGAGSSGSTWKYSSKEMALDILELINYLNWKKIHLVGISMGGMISLEFASLAPERLLSLALVVTHAGSIAPMKGIMTIFKTLFIKDHHKRGNLVADISYSTDYLLKKSIFDPNKTNRDIFVEKYVSDSLNIKSPSMYCVYGHMKTVAFHSLSKKRLLEIKSSSKKFNFPITILTGTNDDLVKSNNSFYLNEILNPFEFTIFESSGHSINIENYEEFHKSIRRLFKHSIERQNN